MGEVKSNAQGADGDSNEESGNAPKPAGSPNKETVETPEKAKMTTDAIITDSMNAPSPVDETTSMN